jgi:FMN phosphatase YigB (HAD superfamily)
MDPAPRAVILDLDDTLCDYSSARELRLRIAFSQAFTGREPAATKIDMDRLVQQSIQWQPHGTDHFKQLLAQYGVDEHAAARAAQWFQSNRFHGLKLFPEAESVLGTLRGPQSGDSRIDRRVGIVTNGPREVQRAKLHHLGLAPLIDFVIISEEFGCAKPDAAIFSEALKLADAEVSEAVVIGDQSLDELLPLLGAGTLR